jgi:hypothetical protein
MLDQGSLDNALRVLGQLLADRGQHFEVVVIGGGGLLLLGINDRPTRDLDLVAFVTNGRLHTAEPLPPELAHAARETAELLGLADDWLNAGPTSLLRFPGLPPGFLERTERRGYGALDVRVASRLDQIHFKLFAAVDDKPHGKHHRDLIRLAPTVPELLAAATWACGHDPSPYFAVVLAEVLATFGVERSS